ncbi:mitochondrial processing peptidase subunit [Trichuris trichiura]|uniref:Mitochondrial processing peptidase subunit n=1 Tax=Trichuris trichiura TaxID=36087 RepID=A0A077ZAA1_TRITR|nr:mitochondrial processing peptidase subunit [Trichuris trichiura]
MCQYVLSLPTTCRIPFGHPLPDLPTVKFSKKPPEIELYKTNVTILENGVTVASEPTFGEFCTIGAVVNAGSRYEAKFPKGISHFLEKLAFTPSKKFKNSDEITQIMEKNGAIVDCQHTKDSLIYASSCRASSAEAVLELIAESLFHPNFSEAEIATAREVVKSNVEAITMKPEPEELLNDLIHAAAYRDNTLGLPKYCQPENFDKIDKADLFSFMRTYYTPNRIIVGEEKMRVDESLAQYTGGEIRIEKDLSNVGMAINPFPELGHFVIGFESCKFTDEDFVPFCVLNSLMGGGGSFSAGGPGKGMYTRLYMNVLNRRVKYHWIYNATSVNLGYADSGIFFIRASTHPKNLGDLVGVICSEMLSMNHGIDKDELERAKTQLKSSLLMNLEQRPVRFEDLTRQILGQGMRKSPLEYVDAIGEVRASDIDRVVNRLLNTRVSIVGYGSLKKLPSCDTIDRAIAKRNLSFLKSPSYFFM